ncbi:MAG: hypothetical protein K2N22_02495 [Clostridia bacterium]|nr:hypothetical protein [Clostridia bacterium]
MKKWLLALIAAVVAVAVCVGLSACAGGNDGGVVAKEITLSETSVTLELDGEKSLTYTVEPAEAEVKIEVSDETVVRYENDKLTAVTVGTATVKVYAEKNSSVYAECAVTVNAPEGFNSVSGASYKFICPESWTKKTMTGVVAYYFNSTTGSNLNLINSAKIDATWTITEEAYTSTLTSSYQQMGYTVNSMQTKITDDTHLGKKRRVITVDSQVKYLGVTMNMHQQQALMQSANYTYTLTLTYVNDYDTEEPDLIISQFVVK